MDNNLIIESQLEFIKDDDEAFASVSHNPYYQMVKLIVCDNDSNKNKERVPSEEFENMIRTGVHSPIKMSEGKISDHAEAFGKPIGAITHLIQENNIIKAIGVLWKRERPEDVEALKKMWEEGHLPQVSWEVSYSDSDVGEDGIKNLRGVVLNGVAIVERPAYAGRTPIYAMAEESDDDSNQNDPAKSNLEGNSNVEEELAQVKAELESLRAELAEANQKVADLTTERDSLAEYKSSVEAEKEKKEKLASIKQKFVDAGVEKDESYFEDKAEMLLKLEDDELDYMIQEFVSFASNKNDETNSSIRFPNVHSNKDLETDPKKLAEALRELRNKK